MRSDYDRIQKIKQQRAMARSAYLTHRAKAYEIWILSGSDLVSIRLYYLEKWTKKQDFS